ncbi:PREDICTED: uncharacterized protein LOC108760982, partial [Trachymyrmex cornetzi]|uniref:uncharacterized protein LOC108760982 n=1 Tax=Trachymyrmex cornetzi TaxID=471704 RepID=UPI00084F1ACB
MKMYAQWAKLSAFIEHKVGKIDPKFKTHSNPDKKIVQLLSKLPSLFPVYTAIVGKGKSYNWRPSLCERRELFLWRIETYGDLNTKINERREKLHHFKLTLQPQAVIIGSSETDIKHSIVIVDKIHYEVESPLKAIDIAFKCIHSLHAEYPKESEQVYLFLQTGIYGITSKYNKKFSA